MFTVVDNAEAFLKALGQAEKAVGFARTVALTRTARATAGGATTGGFIARGFLSEEAQRVFDRPTRWTLGAFWWRPATADRSVFEVGVKDFAGKGVPASKYLRAEILGGQRRKKRSEAALTRLMGNRSFWVPGPGVTLDAFGNVPGSTIRRILSDLQVAGDQSRTARSRGRNARYGRERYFVPQPGSRLASGVWIERPAGSRRILPALFFVTEAGYRKRFDFFGRGMAFAVARFPIEMAQALREGWHLPRVTQKALGLGGRI